VYLESTIRKKKAEKKKKKAETDETQGIGCDWFAV